MSYMAEEYPGVREYECDGAHARRDLRYTGPDDTLQVEVCSDPVCARVFAQCVHTKCSWNNEGTILSCNFCNRDAT